MRSSVFPHSDPPGALISLARCWQVGAGEQPTVPQDHADREGLQGAVAGGLLREAARRHGHPATHRQRQLCDDGPPGAGGARGQLLDQGSPPSLRFMSGHELTSLLGCE